ncbi:PKD domain protein [Pelotomaculum schinkii]|uniref:PKD domain protein n=1 Tax=Pelotomaculum schinkii TaxID=78350 RepID=A0A4Y7RBP8_9FIRM|nr:PKD domain-containing protein [Pelotomaculum schinkii]TEB06189.1 PKD domain protein [Pelotomaculum schinkii]
MFYAKFKRYFLLLGLFLITAFFTGFTVCYAEENQNTVVSQTYQNTVVSQTYQNTVVSQTYQNTVVSQTYDPSMNNKKILFINDGSYSNNNINGNFSNLANMLISEGYLVEERNLNPIASMEINNYDIIVFGLGSRVISQEEAGVLVTFVKNGGSLFLLGDMLGIDENSARISNYSFNIIGKSFGIVSYDDNPIWDAIITDIRTTTHDLTKGVSSFRINLASPLSITSPAIALAYTTERYDYFGAAVLAAAQYGSGRVVSIGDTAFLRNDYINNYDHYTLIHNIFNWLSSNSTEPTLQILSPTERAIIGLGDTVNLSASATGVAHVKFYVENIETGWFDNPGGMISGDGTYSTNWSTSGMDPGKYLVRAVGYSNEGHELVDFAVMIKIIDPIPPTVTIDSPVDNIFYKRGEPIPIKATAEDNIEIWKMYIHITPSWVATLKEFTPNSKQFTVSEIWDSSKLPEGRETTDGSYTISVSATDTGNWGRAEVTINLDGTPPSIIENIPIDGDKDVLLTGKIILKFNEPVEVVGNPYVDRTILIKNNTPGLADPYVNFVARPQDGNTVILERGDGGNWSAHTNYTVMIKPGAVKDRAGNELTVGKTFSFTTVNTPPVADAKGPYTGNEGSAITFSGSGADADNDQLTYSWDFGDGLSTPFSSSATALHTYTDNGNFTATLTVKDSYGGIGTANVTVTVNTVAPTIESALLAPVQVKTAITAIASFSDPGTLDTHTAVWDWGDGTTSPATVTETNGSGSVNGSHTYTSAGVYTVTLTVTDKDGGTGTSTSVSVVYDPNGGFVTGGGWINSAAGAYAADPSITGETNFGFVSKYQKGARMPKGNTEFQFNAGSLNFLSTSYDWLVISGNKAQCKGSGTINGTGNYGFMLTATDGQYNGGTAPDMFRIKITNNTDGSVVYDNQMNAADNADPTTVIGGGSIVIHK